MIETARYTRTARLLHWSVATLILVNIALAWSADKVGDDQVRSVIDMHKSIGITVLGLVLLRLAWRLTHRPPPLPRAYPAWERRAAHLAHWTLYALILAMPIAGWLHDSAWNGAAAHPLVLFGFIPWFRIGAITALDPATKGRLHDVFGAIHAAIGYWIIALFVLHVAGALKHQWWDGEPELRRISL